MHRASREVVIVGGGPAGCAAATLLARWGHRVTLVTRPVPDTSALGESIPPSTCKLFDVLGVRERIDAAGFVRSTGHTVWWGAREPRIEYFAEGLCGWQVTTDRLERVLRAAVVDSGAVIDESRIADDDDEVVTTRAEFVLDCSGRAGVFARRRRLRVHEPSHRTVAIIGVWQADTFSVPDPTHTLIESYEGGWVWSVPRTATERYVAVMVDPRTSTLTRQEPSRQIYLAELAKAEFLRGSLKSATLVDGPRGWDASMYRASRYVDGNVLLVGDAASFVDPLSSAGVKKALASGWLAAVATHTSLITPSMRETALEFFAAREVEVYASFRAMTESFLREAAAGHTHPFWSDRVQDAPLAHRAAVEVEFDRLRQAPELCVGRNPATRVEPRPAVNGTQIILEQRLVADNQLAGVRYAYGVDLVALVALAPEFTCVPDLFTAYGQRHAPVAWPDFLAALATAIAEKWLVWCGKT